MRIDRMLAITVLLLSRERVSAKELSERFEVSIRTIYRDMDAINIAGIPIISFPGADGGFGIMEGFKLDRQIFTTQDMVSILTNLEGINRAFKSEAITKVTDKIHSLIPSNEVKRIKSSLSKLIIDIHPWGLNDRWKKDFRDIQRSIEDNRVIKIHYVSGEGKTTKRELEPMTLIFKSYTWYIWGYCLKREDYRLFKISRIRDIEVTDKRFIYRGEVYKEIEKYPGTPVKIVLESDEKFYFKALEHFGLENIDREDNKILITLLYPPGEWIKEHILSFGSHIKVLEPKWLQDEIKEESMKILKSYQT